MTWLKLKTTHSILGPSIRPRTACCDWCWNWTAKSYSAPTRTSACCIVPPKSRSEEHTSELQSLMRISYAVFCLQTKTSDRKLQTETYTIYGSPTRNEKSKQTNKDA